MAASTAGSNQQPALLKRIGPPSAHSQKQAISGQKPPKNPHVMGVSTLRLGQPQCFCRLRATPFARRATAYRPTLCSFARWLSHLRCRRQSQRWVTTPAPQRTHSKRRLHSAQQPRHGRNHARRGGAPVIASIPLRRRISPAIRLDVESEGVSNRNRTQTKLAKLSIRQQPARSIQGVFIQKTLSK